MKAARIARSRGQIVVSAFGALAVAALLGQSVRSQTTSAVQGPVSVWLTTVDETQLIAAQPAVSFVADSGTNPLTIDVNPSIAYQVIDGFGASFTDSSAWLVYTRMPTAAREQLMNQLFDRTAGIGLSVLRQPIAASDFALNQYSYDDMPRGQTDPTLAHFSIDHDRAYILPVLTQALQINPQLRIIATPWSPPGWMKSSGSMLGGSLNASAEDAFANYLVRFIQGYQAAGVPIDRLTPQNEPEYTPTDYPGMWMEAPQQAEFIAYHLGPALRAAGLQTRIDAWDHNWNDPTYAPTVFADPAASPFVAGSAWHCYAGTPDAMTTVRNQYPDKEIIFSECSGYADTKYTFGQGFARDMDLLVIGATRNWARTIVKWNIALDTNHGPHTGGCDDCSGLVTIDQASGAVVRFNYDYYSLGQISKFVVPGARRIASNTFAPWSIEDVAFQNPDGSKVLIAFNGDTAAHTFKVREGTDSFSYTLPALAAVTFKWTTTVSPGTPPAVAVTSPLNGSSFTAPASIALVASASSPAGISQVRFYSGTTLIGSANSSPYAVTWTNVPAGAYTVTATATGNDGGVATSAAVAITVVDASAANLAAGRPVVASSIENSSYAAANVVDGRTTTRWSSAFSDPQWIHVDLGSRITLSRVAINWEAAFAAAYQLQVSDDATSWTTFYSTTAGKGGTETITPSTTITGRYLRVYCTTRTYVYGGQWGYSIWELQVYGTAAPSSPPVQNPNLALGRTAVASSVENSSYPAAGAVDGRMTTRWSSAFSDPQWIYVDLGSRFTLSTVVINWEAAFATAYRLQVSDDATTWTTFYSTTVGKGGTETITPGAAPTGRYLRVYCTARTYAYGEQWGYSIWELQAYGTAASSSPPAATTNLALGHVAVASSVENSSYPAAGAVDGRTTTRWSSAFADPQWIFVDLGSRFTLSRVVINWEAAFATAYQLQVSDDAMNWTTFYSTSAGAGGTETITPSTPATGRYVRVYCTTRTSVDGHQYGDSIWELQMYGTAAP